MKRFIVAVLGILCLFMFSAVFAQDANVPAAPGPAPTELPSAIGWIFMVAVPFVVQLLKKWIPTGNGKFWVSIGMAIVGGVLSTIVSGIHLTFANLFVWVSATIAYGAIIYRLLIQYLFPKNEG
jgi:hypothetical protein